MSQATDASTTKKPKKFRWLIWAALGLVVVLVALTITAGIIAKSYVDPDYIVSAIEAENNCRVEIASTDVSLFSFPAKIVINGVKLAPRDDYADAGTKLADRPALVGITAFTAKSVTLEANLFDLIRKRISVEHLSFEEVSIGELLIEEEGSPRLTKDGPKLDDLFDPPVLVAGSLNPEFEEKTARREAAKERKARTKEERAKNPDQPFAISELPIPATMAALNFSNAQINAKIRRNKTRITISKLNIKISDIDLDPDDLENHNQARVTITGHLDIEDKDRSVKFASLDLRSEGDVIPFDPVTGYLNPDLTYQITVLKGSTLDAIPALVKLSGKIEKLEKIGLKLEGIGDDITIEKDTIINLGYRQNTMRLVGPTVLDFSGHSLTVKDGAWLHSGNNQHQAEAEITLSQAASDKALTNARDFLKDKAKQFSFDQDLALKYVGKLLAPVTKNGRVFVPFSSKGDFNDPKVRPDIDIKDLTESMALEAFGDLLEKAQKEAGEQE